MTMRGLPACLFLLASFACCNGFQYFQTLMPNGDKVQHPCLANRIWKGVGHFNQKGGGSRNPFGVDFKSAGSKWTRDLCMKDSDGDGMTNGAELGDPSCTWTVGKVPSRVTNITHPGVCEPLNTANCRARNKADWNLCEAERFVCNDTKGPNVTSIDIRMTYTTVPKKITNYYCQAFALPNATDLHLIALEPLINNTNVMHHILLFGCSKKPAASHFTTPYECGMGGTGCSSLLGGWTLGSSGDCFTQHSGVRIGLKGYKYIVMQVHWNNPEMRSDYKDSSGMRFYLTTNLRGNDSALFTIGQRYLTIPPGKTEVLQEATCSSNCTSRHLPFPIYLQNVLPHMHNAGKFSQISQYRGGVKIRDLVPYSRVSYDDPKTIILDPPVEFRPGDQLYMKCVYKTTTEKNTLYYGDATADEMCFGFFRYYPAQTKLTSCVNYGKVDLCTVNDRENGGDGRYLPGRVGDCANLGAFLFYTLAKVWVPLITEHCDYSIDICRPSCKAVVQRLEKEPCWSGWSKNYIDFMSTYPTGASLRELRLATLTCSLELKREAGLAVKNSKLPVMTTISPTHSHSGSKTSKEEQWQKQQTILIAVGSAAAGLLLLSVAAVGFYRAFVYVPPAKGNTFVSQVPDASQYQTQYLQQPQITSDYQKGFDNIAGPDAANIQGENTNF